MTDKIIIVTAPDDVPRDGVRILLVDLDRSQTSLVSKILTTLKKDVSIIVYMWNSLDDVDWLLSKKHSADLIIFNANSENDVIIGYMSAQKNSHYLGTLKLLFKVNGSVINSEDEFLDILEDTVNRYETR